MAAALVLTLGLSGALAFTDYTYADVYRRAARHRVGIPPGNTVYFLGHWGWQWYATRAGMLQYDASNTELRPGDIVVVPEGVARQTLSDRHRRQLVLQEQVAWSANWDIGIRTMTRQRVDGWAGDFYTSGVRTLPWTTAMASAPLEQFSVFRYSARGGEAP